jgi:DNA-binding NtrC family response regulator
MLIALRIGMQARVLIVDDERDECEHLERLTRRLDYVPVCTTSPEAALDLIGKESFSVILTDLGMSTMGGLELCSRIVGARPDVPVVVVTGLGSMEAAIEAMRAGAYDFLNKPLDANVLELALRRAVQNHRLQEEIRLLSTASPSGSSEWMIGESEPVMRVKDIVSRVGVSDVTVLVHGETGTGKELIARAVHRFSARSEGAFIAINCAAVPASLLESELFGHARGAFTDAKISRDGLFVRASGGTLFLDEIGDMPLEMQAKLLRALQERVVRPVGSNTEVPFDTRIVAATHRDLETDIANGKFREDLYYRINVVKITAPPLRERGNDVLLLASHFLAQTSQRCRKEAMGLSPQVASLLLAYEWPGNVRELENCIERAVALARFNSISAEDLPERIRTFAPKQFSVVSEGGQEILPLDEIERRYILRALSLLDGNRSRAASLLGVDRRTLYRKLERYAGANGTTAVPQSLEQ